MDRELKSMVVEEMKEGGESWMNDMRTYIESAHIPDYNPVDEFLAACGSWDRKHDYIEDFARRLPTDYEAWPRYFHRREHFWQVQAIQQELAKRLKASDVPNLKTLGATLKRLRWERGGIDGLSGYYLKLKS